IDDDAADADYVVAALADLLRKALQGGEVEQGAGGVDIGLDHHQPEGAVKHPEGKAPLHAGDLVLVQFHRVDPAASVLVVPVVWTEDAGEKDAGSACQGVAGGYCGVVRHDFSFAGCTTFVSFSI